MSNLQGRDARKMSMASVMMVSCLGEILITKGLITSDEAASVVQSAQGGASVHSTISTPGAALAIQEVGDQWESASGRRS